MRRARDDEIRLELTVTMSRADQHSDPYRYMSHPKSGSRS